jgi:hypothetical protein
VVEGLHAGVEELHATQGLAGLLLELGVHLLGAVVAHGGLVAGRRDHAAPARGLAVFGVGEERVVVTDADGPVADGVGRGDGIPRRLGDDAAAQCGVGIPDAPAHQFDGFIGQFGTDQSVVSHVVFLDL